MPFSSLRLLRAYYNTKPVFCQPRSDKKRAVRKFLQFATARFVKTFVKRSLKRRQMKTPSRLEKVIFVCVDEIEIDRALR